MTEAVLLRPSTVGPVTPELAIKTLIYPSSFSMCSTMLLRDPLDVTSPWRGMMFPCFFKEISITCLEGKGGDKRLVKRLSREFLFGGRLCRLLRRFLRGLWPSLGRVLSKCQFMQRRIGEVCNGPEPPPVTTVTKPFTLNAFKRFMLS